MRKEAAMLLAFTIGFQKVLRVAFFFVVALPGLIDTLVQLLA